VKRFVKSQFALDLKTVSRNNIDSWFARLDDPAIDAFLSMRDTVMAPTRLSQLAARLADAPAKGAALSVLLADLERAATTSGGTQAGRCQPSRAPRAEDVTVAGNYAGYRIRARGVDGGLRPRDLRAKGPGVSGSRHALLRFTGRSRRLRMVGRKGLPRNGDSRRRARTLSLRQVCKQAVLGLGLRHGARDVMIRVPHSAAHLSLDSVAGRV